MPKNSFLDWDTTASNNTDIGGIGTQGTNLVSNFDDALRTLMAQLRSGLDGKTVYAAKSANYTAVANDNNGYLRFTAAATLSLTAVATLGANWHIFVQADGGDVTVDPNSSETINGATTITIKNGESALIISTGSAFFARVNALATYNTLSGDKLPGQLFGLTLSNNATDATNDIDIAVGSAAADTSPYYLMTLGSALTKQLDGAWAVGTNQGMRDTGSIADGWWYIFLIQRSDTSVADILASLSATAPTMPTSYDRKRLIGAIFRTGGAIKAFTQFGRWIMWGTPIEDLSTATPSSAGALLTLTAPALSGANVRLGVFVSNGTEIFAWVRPTSMTNDAAAIGNCDVAITTAGGRDSNEIDTFTNGSGQVRYRSSTGITGNFRIATKGFRIPD